jgi:type I restriction enzyme R subunit
LRGRDIREAFKGEEYQILLVANKFQTGFDQPLLCGMYVDKRLDGIQAVQTLSRLNRSHAGKDTTFVVDFVNNPDDILAAFKMYHTTAELAGTTDPNLVFNLKDKLDALGHYDANEVDRVVRVELNPKAKQGDLVAALEPVVDRLMKQYKAAQVKLQGAKANQNEKVAQDAKDEMEALILFKRDMAVYQRLYTFLSQIINYENPEVEKRAIFYKRLIPLLDFGREREGIDLSKVVLTHHHLKDHGKQNLKLGQGEKPLLDPIKEAGTGGVNEKEKVRLSEVIEKVNELFGKETTDQDQLVYIQTLKEKMLESETLQQQAASNTKEQFRNSPDLKNQQQSAIMDALDAHQNLSKRALNSETVQSGMLHLLLEHFGLYEALKEKAVG